MTTIRTITGEVLYKSDKPLKEALEEAIAVGVSLKFAQLDSANLAGADLSKADLAYASLSEANLAGADLSGAILTQARLRHANLSGADLTRASARHANFACANLSEACLCNVSLYGANLLYATLTNADITYASVNYAIFNPSTLNGASIDGHTIVSAAAFGPIGSRNDKLLAVQTVDGLFFQAGCFFGTKEELLAAVESTHGGTRHERDYKLAIDFLESYLKDREEG